LLLGASAASWWLIGSDAYDDGWKYDELASIALLSRLGVQAQDGSRGPEAIKTVYGWREDQWRQASRGLAAAVAAILIAMIPLLIKGSNVELTYSAGRGPATTAPSATRGQTPSPAPSQPVPSAPPAAGPVETMRGLPLASAKVTGANSDVPDVVWLGFADLVVLALLAAMGARAAHRSYAADIAAFAELEQS
jgi:hypothetical protein